MLDLSRMLPGPFASHVLADLGMEVIKVEEPEPRYGMGRDPLTPPDPTPAEEVRWAAYNGVARNKKSIALNLMDPATRAQAQEIFFRLVRDADVVLDGYRPGALKWLGVDYETVKQHKSDIIYCSLTGFGQDGPYAQRPAHGGQFEALAGGMAVGPDGAPVRYPVPLGDMSGALYGAICIVSALLDREHGGGGVHIDVPLTATAMSLMVMQASAFQREAGSGEVRRGGGPSVGYLKCKDDKWLSTGNSETVFWENFCKVLGRPEWISLRRTQGPEMETMVRDVEAIFLTKTRDEWVDILVKADTCVAPVNNIEEALQDPQMRHLGMAWDLQHPTVGAVQQIGFPVRFSGESLPPAEFAPVLGQHTREVLRGAGYTDDVIQKLEAEGIVKSWT